MLITTRPANADGDRIVLVAFDTPTAERMHDKIAAAYPKATVTTRVGKAFGVVAAPTADIGRIEGLIADLAPAAGSPPQPKAEQKLAADSLDLLEAIASLDSWPADVRTDVNALLADIDEDILRAVIAAALGDE